MKRNFFLVLAIMAMVMTFFSCTEDPYMQQQNPDNYCYSSDELKQHDDNVTETATRRLEAEYDLEKRLLRQREDDGWNSYGNDDPIKVVRGFGYMPANRIYRVEFYLFDTFGHGRRYEAYDSPVRHLDHVRIEGGKPIRVCLTCGSVAGFHFDQIKDEEGEVLDGDYTAVAVFIDQVTGQRYVFDVPAFRDFWGPETPTGKVVIKDVVWSFRKLGEDTKFVVTPAWYNGDHIRDAIAEPVEGFYFGVIP